MAFAATHPCPLCQAAARLACDHQPGYREPTRYAIYQCAGCAAAFAQPHAVDDDLYNLIYANPWRIPSYRRYQTYAAEVRQAADPLAYLAAAEDMYWGIERYFAARDTGGAQVLDVGCGLGYLTYALNRRGIKTVGLDISQQAVDQARRTFGDHYVCADIAAHAAAVGRAYDAIILSEVIEHIADVNALFASLDRLLRAGGAIVVTTPNKSFYADHILWHTDPPPVHLWWFAEESLVALGRRFGYQVEFIDYAPFNRQNPPEPAVQAPAGQPTRHHVLTRRGRLFHPKNPAAYARRFVRALGLGPQAIRLKRAIGRIGKPPQPADVGGRRGTLCAVLTRQNAA